MKIASPPYQIPHNKPPTIDKQLQSLVLGNTSNNEEASEIPPIPFLTLPYDVRLQIYRWAVGNRMIHIVAKRAINPLRRHYCTSHVSEAQIYEDYSKPVVFKNRVDTWMRPRQVSLSMANYFTISIQFHVKDFGPCPLILAHVRKY